MSKSKYRQQAIEIVAVASRERPEIVADLICETQLIGSYQRCLKHSVTQTEKLLEAQDRVEELEALLNTPETNDFYAGIELEAAHQRHRWPSDQDAGKAPADWFWLVGYLAGKCLASHISGNTEKALHHTISTAAALANWHRAIKGFGNMRPGIDEPSLSESDALLSEAASMEKERTA